MWVAEGLTHRYPTKVLAELPTCPSTAATAPGWTWSATPRRPSTSSEVRRKPQDRLGAMLDYLRRTPSVRDVVVSGATWRTCRGLAWSRS